MTNIDEVHFISFETDHTEYTLPVGVGVYTQVIISGQIFKGGYSGYKVNIKITKADGTLDDLSITPDDSTDIARFATPYELDQYFPVGTYTLFTTYIQPTINSQASFIVDKA